MTNLERESHKAQTKLLNLRAGDIAERMAWECYLDAIRLAMRLQPTSYNSGWGTAIKGGRS